MKTLLYLASGTYNSEYEQLPYDQIICVDYCSSAAKTYPQYETKVRFIKMDALLAIEQLRKEKIQIDCLVSMNEGLDEGGGIYPMFSGFLMGYLSPILKDEIILICDLEIYNNFRNGLASLDWGFHKKSEHFKGDEKYIDPRTFMNHRENISPRGQVFCMKKNREIRSISINESLSKLQLIHGSIWEDQTELDFIGFSLTSIHSLPRTNNSQIRTPADFFKSKGVVDTHLLPFKEIISMARNKGAKNIGLGPWNKGEYQEAIAILKTEDFSDFESIRFYHLSPKDFKMLYAI